MTSQIKKLASDYLRRYAHGELTSDIIIKALESQGYNIVKFNNVQNSADITELSILLGIENYMLSSKGFAYADSNNRIVFLHEDLSEDEMIHVLLHEQGHILCRHFSEGNILGNDVIQEYEANEFVHYVMNPGVWCFIIRNHRPIVISIIILLTVTILFSVIGMINGERSYYGEYYITETGHKYHEANCIFVKNKNNIRRITKVELESGEYEPCAICLPSSNGTEE